MNIEVDGEHVEAHRGETVAGVLMRTGRRAFRLSPTRGAPRGVYCGIGLCHECLVEVNGVPNQRACRTYVVPGLQISTDAQRLRS